LISSSSFPYYFLDPVFFSDKPLLNPFFAFSSKDCLSMFLLFAPTYPLPLSVPLISFILSTSSAPFASNFLSTFFLVNRFLL